MFDKLCENVDILMTKMRISADELSRRTGLPASTIKKIRNRRSPNPTLSTLLPLAQFFSITLNQLIGTEPITQIINEDTFNFLPQSIIRNLPILTWEESILWPKGLDKPHSMLTTAYSYSDNAYALIVEEDDWENLSRGTALLIDPLITTEHRDFVIVYKSGNTIPTLKQILYDEGEKYLKPIIQGYGINRFTSDHKILGVVVEYKKQLKNSQDEHKQL